VIFVDLVMPNIDGKRLCKTIRGMDKLKDAFVIILSSIAADEQIDFTEMGANACIAKGSFHEMARNIKSVLNQSDPKLAQRLSKEVIGIESGYPQVITKEFLSVGRRFEAILERMSEGILEITAEGRIIYANPRAAHMLQLAEEKLLGSLFVKHFPETDHQRIEELLKTASETSKAITGNFPIQLNEHQVTLNMVPIEGNGSTTAVVINQLRGRGLPAEAQNANHEALRKQIEEQAAELSKKTLLLKLEMENRKGAEAALKSIEGKLEGKIREQIEELSQSNEVLKKEINDLKGAEAVLRKSRDEFKMRLGEQTEELSKKNALLKEEKEKHKQTEQSLKKTHDKLKTRINEIAEELLNLNKDMPLKEGTEKRKRTEEASSPRAKEPLPYLLELSLADQKIEMKDRGDTVSMGRHPNNDLVVADMGVSRSHAQIVYRENKFILIDHSKNGTYIHVKGKQGAILQFDEYPLSGTGVIGLNWKAGPDSLTAIKFRILSPSKTSKG
jgi:PAS domain S-box-containing protein